MPKVKREHYVARSYLRGFTDDGEHLCAFDKHTRKHFTSISVDEVANEKYFYDLSDSQVTEEKLAHLDGMFPKWRDSIIQTVVEGKSITLEQQVKLAFYISMQIRRTRWFRNFIINIAEQVEEALGTMARYYTNKFGTVLKPDTSLLKYLASDKEGMAKNEQIQSMHSFRVMMEMIRILANHIWIIGVNQTPQTFYTSDHPISAYPHLHHPIKSYSGLRSKGIEIVFPLNSRYILSMCERSYHTNLEILDCKSMDIDANGVTYFNGFQVVQSNRWIYSNSDEFDLADEILSASK